MGGGGGGGGGGLVAVAGGLRGLHAGHQQQVLVTRHRELDTLLLQLDVDLGHACDSISYFRS